MTWLLTNWKLVALGTVLALSHAFTWRAGGAGAREELADYKRGQSEQRLLADRAQRTEEQRRTAAVAKEVQDAQPIIQAEARDAAALPDSRLQQPAIRHIQRACPNPPAAASGPPAVDPLMVFADVFGRLEQRSEDLARLAGERGAAGTTCERVYDSLTAK